MGRSAFVLSGINPQTLGNMQRETFPTQHHGLLHILTLLNDKWTFSVVLCCMFVINFCIKKKQQTSKNNKTSTFICSGKWH